MANRASMPRYAQVLKCYHSEAVRDYTTFEYSKVEEEMQDAILDGINTESLEGAVEKVRGYVARADAWDCSQLCYDDDVI